ncbi:SETMAR [Cordylochernes scorpioides]|uniref:SETMAR n=1 Tax=Cordylochernes scorpioides TaxID=51811 RepID=A0ABY6KRK6_9ARAC|nr:SETMAR [Cordylochernes scorpioides]
MRNGSTSAILRTKSRGACPANFQNGRLGLRKKGNALCMVGPDRRSIFRAPETWPETWREALNEKRPEWREKHNKLIPQHDNAPAHNATVVKNTIKDLGWKLLPHPPYSPDLAPSDYHLFTSLGHALKKQEFSKSNILRKWLVDWFNSKGIEFFRQGIQKLPESAADGHRLLCEAYGEHALSIKSCEYWFRRFKSGDFDTRDKERGGRPIKFEDAELEAFLDEDSSQTQEELAETLGVTQQAISNRLKIHYDNPKRRKSWGKPGHASTSTAKPNIHGKKLMLCIWWDQLGVIYYELLQPNKTITGERYQQQLMRLSRALKIKRSLYAKRHDKVIYQHDNARPHVAKVVKETLEALQWDVLPHPPYSPDIAPSDYHMFCSMTHGLAEQHFTSYEEAKNWVDVWIASKDEEFFRHGIRMLPEKRDKVVAKDGQYSGTSTYERPNIRVFRDTSRRASDFLL